MIDPTKITNYRQSARQLEEMALFWICAAGKNGKTAARCLSNLLNKWKPVAASFIKNPTPFDIIKQINYRGNLAEEMRVHGIGCYNIKARSFLCLVFSLLNLKTCSVEDLEKIPGFGPKTARCFLIHSRKDQPYAGLDTHILKFMRDMGYDVPKSTPTGRKYRQLEAIFLDLARIAGKSTAEFDLMIWNAYSGNGGRPEDVLALFHIVPLKKLA
jgi:hypothetical protein